MSDHLHEQQRGWSPGQSVTPGECSPGREACKPACGCQHGPARVETTTGAPAAVEPDVPATPAVTRSAYAGLDSALWDLEENAGAIRASLKELRDQHIGVLERIAEAEEDDGDSDRAVWAAEDAAALARSEELRAGRVAPEAEAKWEMSREALELLLGNPVVAPSYVANVIRALLAHDLALRTRAREAEERAEMYARAHQQEVMDGVARLTAAFRERDAERYMRGVNQRAAENAEKAVTVVRRERDEATTRAKVADRTAEEWEAARDSDVDAVWAEVADAAMKAWDKPQPYNDSPAELIAKIINERDEAREQRDAALDRADEVTRDLAVAEAEVKRLQGEHPVRLGEISEAFTGTIPTCWSKDATGSVVQRVAALRERCRRLEEAGGKANGVMRRLLDARYHVTYAARQADVEEWLAAWAAAKGALDAPAAGGGKG